MNGAAKIPSTKHRRADSIAKFSAYLMATADFAVLSASSAAATSMVLKPIPVATRQPRLTVTFMRGDSPRPLSQLGPLKTQLSSF